MLKGFKTCLQQHNMITGEFAVNIAILTYFHYQCTYIANRTILSCVPTIPKIDNCDNISREISENYPKEVTEVN